MIHTETLECPCRPETRRQIGGGSVQVHRLVITEGRQNDSTPASDRICRACDGWHLTGHPHLEMVTLLRTLENEVRSLPAEGIRHTGMYVERAAVVTLLNPRRIAA